MKKIKENEIQYIIGGSNYISGSIISAFVNVIKLLIDAGETVGSSIRRIADNKVCPLK